jgi:hypothetical protein
MMRVSSAVAAETVRGRIVDRVAGTPIVLERTSGGCPGVAAGWARNPTIRPRAGATLAAVEVVIHVTPRTQARSPSAPSARGGGATNDDMVEACAPASRSRSSSPAAA